MLPNSKTSLAIILVIAFAIRLTAGVVWQARLDGQFAMGDSDGYWQLARTIAEGKPYQYDEKRIFRTPGYPVLLAPILFFGGDSKFSLYLARGEAALFGAIAIAALWWLTRLLFNEKTALLAAALASVYPGAIMLSVLILSEAPFTPLMILNLAFWIKTWNSPDPKKQGILAFFTGVIAGLATLMRPSWLLFTPFALGLGIVYVAKQYKSGRSGRSADKHEICLPEDKPEEPDLRNPLKICWFRYLALALYMLAGLVIAMLPWWIRNAMVVGRFIPTTLQVGASLYDGLNPKATGASNMDFVPAITEAERRCCLQNPEKCTQPFEVLLDRRMRSEAISWALAHPGRVLELAGIKFLRIWNIWPNEASYSKWPFRLIVFFTYTPLLIFAIIGACRTAAKGWPYVLCWLPAVYFTMLHVIFVSSIRYREPAMMAMIALAAAAIIDITGRSRN